MPDGLTLEKIKAQPHGIDMGPMVPRAREMVCTPDGLIDLAPEYIVGDLPRLRDARSPRPRDDGLRLVSRRHLRSKNSWMHNVKVLVKGKDRCTLLVHPDDAAGGGLVDGGRARVSSEAGSIEVPVEVSDEMMPGVVSLPHGWGHDRPGTRLSVAREHAGVNNNLLAPTHFYDTLSNNHAVNGIPVEVVPGLSVRGGAGGGGRNRTHRTGITVPLVLKTRGPPDPVHLRAVWHLDRRFSGSAPVASPQPSRPEGTPMKKLLIVLILAAIGIAVAKKVREA